MGDNLPIVMSKIKIIIIVIIAGVGVTIKQAKGIIMMKAQQEIKKERS
jgi:hypothetical protein